MDITRKSCRLCLTETEFNTPLFGNYCRKTNMVDKILVCLKIDIKETDIMNTICYKCAAKIERYYNFTMFVKKSQAKLAEPRIIENVNRRVTSYVREQVYDAADYSFSFLEMPNEEAKKEKVSSPFFSYFSPPNVMMKQPKDHVWKTPRPRHNNGDKPELKKQKVERTRHHSRDLFESQSQDVEDDPRSLDWKLTPEDNIIKRVREKFFGRADY